MANKLMNVTVRKDLTEYAFGIMQDSKKLVDLANLLSPVVPTGGTSGLFNKFEVTNAFVEYAKSMIRRAVGGQANEIGLLSDTATYTCMPFGLRTKIDEFERRQAGDNNALLEQAKTRTLTINCLVGYLSMLLTAAKASVSAESGKGTWANPNVDPIQELNDLIKAVFLASGMLPNVVMVDFGAWCVLSGNPKVLNRMPGADIAAVTPMRIQGMLVNPEAQIVLNDAAVLTGGGLANSSATRKGIMNGSVLAFYTSKAATTMDPSFMKTFAPTANLFSEVYSYREEPHFDWFENNWESDSQVISSLLCKRIDVTGANS
jgi:hypothetical protein